MLGHNNTMPSHFLQVPIFLFRMLLASWLWSSASTAICSLTHTLTQHMRVCFLLHSLTQNMQAAARSPPLRVWQRLRALRSATPAPLYSDPLNLAMHEHLEQPCMPTTTSPVAITQAYSRPYRRQGRRWHQPSAPRP